ncbi:MAG TPA: hypothetical protein VL134_11430 [Leptolyngbya sp.]|nr:hypothetical protein [Leptolyngbya sp.]
MHSPALTEKFVAALHLPRETVAIFPSDRQPVYSPHHILEFFSPHHSVLILAFSAGVVGAIAAARIWQRQGISISAFIAIDGWGVPLFGKFPIHRISHDRFTHWSSTLLENSTPSFYADPPVEHLSLWHSPQLAQGMIQPSNQPGTAATFITDLIQHYSIE